MKTDKIQSYIAEIKKFTNIISKSKKKSQEFLLKTGIYTKKCNLKNEYK